MRVQTPIQIAQLGLLLALVLMPWVGVGVGQLVLGRALGFGLQPALLASAVALLVVGPRILRGAATPTGPDLWFALALTWTVFSCLALWRLDHGGFAGEAPWSKSLKQVLLLGFLTALLLTPGALLRSSSTPSRLLAQWETAASLGLLLAATYGLAQAAHFYRPMEWMQTAEGWVTSNPSIAAGSDQLYLGHRFVGIPRVRGPACEPLYFGSYLLAVAPLTAAAAWSARGWSRVWRWIAVGLASLGLVLTFSRGVYGAALVVSGLLAVGWWRGRLSRPRPRVALVGTTALVLGVLAAASVFTGTEPWALPGLLGDRVAQSFAGHDMSNLTRVYSWSVALDLARQSPWMGAGWGGYGFHYFGLAGPEATGAHFGWPVANNIALLILAETGVPGLLLWSVALWPAVAALVRRDPQVSAREDSVRFLLAAVVVGIGVQSLTHSQLQLPHLWLVTGISSALASSRFPLV